MLVNFTRRCNTNIENNNYHSVISEKNIDCNLQTRLHPQGEVAPQDLLEQSVLEIPAGRGQLCFFEPHKAPGTIIFQVAF